MVAITAAQRAELAARYGAGVKDTRYADWVYTELQKPAKEAMGPWIAGLAEWVLFPTLTYDLRRVELEPNHVAINGSRNGGRRGGAYRGMAAVAPVSYRVSAEKVERDVRRYARELAAVVRRPVVAVFAIEQHKSGHLHVHGLVGFLEGQAGLSGVLSALVAATQAWYRRHGWAKVRVIETDKDCEAIASYCAKYMTKDYSQLVFVGKFGGR